MYSQVKVPRKVTEKWLTQAFAPLNDYLNKEYPEEARRIMAYMTFMPYGEHRFYYRNAITKGQIVLDQLGQLISCDVDALQYEFESTHSIQSERSSEENMIVHPNVKRWMAERLRRSEEKKYGQEVSKFLQEFWGPLINYDFDKLKVGYPLGGTRLPYCLYLYPADFPKLIAIQFIGDEIVENRCKYARYRQFEERERKLIYGGWQVINVIRERLTTESELFHKYLPKAIELASPRD